MKSLTFKELDLMVEVAESFEGFYVQDLIFSNDVLAMYLRLGAKEAYLIADVGSQKPVFLATQETPPGMKKETKPLLLFLRAHLVGKKLVRARRMTDYGRMVGLRFESSEDWLELEFHLFVQGRNIVARTADSTLSLNKVRDLPPVTNVISDETPRTPAEIYSDWVGFRRGGKAATAADPIAQFEKIKAKKQQGLKGLHEKLRELNDGSLKKAGDWLNENRTLEVPLEFEKYIDHRKSLRENVAGIFEKVKANKKKVAAVEERLALLERELAEITPATVIGMSTRKRAPASPLQDAKGRTKNFENGIAAYIGKSAADNLKILRKAKAWYWWVHPKDLPGSHAIIAVDKGAPLESHILRQVALWTLQETLSAKQWKDWQGVKCQFLYTECRFVTPIKGDKLGRVNYKNEKTLTLTVGDS